MIAIVGSLMLKFSITLDSVFSFSSVRMALYEVPHTAAQSRNRVGNLRNCTSCLGRQKQCRHASPELPQLVSSFPSFSRPMNATCRL